MKFSETVAQVIDLGTAIRNYWDVELPKRHPNFPVVSPGEDSGPPPPEETKLWSILRGLPPDEIYQLALVMYLGRGDFEPDDWAGQYDALKKKLVKPEWLVTQLMGKAPLADYLKDGLTQLKKSGIDPDHLAVASVAASS